MISVAVIMASATLGWASAPQPVEIDRAASCVIRRDPATAVAVAGALPGSQAEQDALARLEPAAAQCRVAAREPLLAGSIAQRFYVATIGPRRAPARARQVNEADAANLFLNSATGLPREDAAVACAVSRNAVAADRLVRTRVGSVEEQQALAGLTQQVRGCVATGEQISLPPMKLRYDVARLLYRETVGKMGIMPDY